MLAAISARALASADKTRKLVSEIERIDFTVSNSEFDALLLENNFIKQNQPKYNILLKDDKTFPYLCILKERFPRIIYTRKYIPKQGEYFGPYSSVVAMKNVLELVRNYIQSVPAIFFSANKILITRNLKFAWSSTLVTARDHVKDYRMN